MNEKLSKNPVPDQAEHNAFFPSPYSLSQYVAPKTDYDGTTYPNAYTGGKWKVLVIASDERYFLMQNGKMFSTGNHPVEMLLPILHMDLAGFEIEIATLSGNPVKLELWAMPQEDEAIKKIYEKYLPQLKSPKKLSDCIDAGLENSDYLGVFVPGGHAAMIGIPHSKAVKDVLTWAINNDRLVISLCHGPACLLAPSIDTDKDDFLFNGYEICVFPDSLDEGINIDIGYIPGKLPWLLAESLQELGVKILNDDITGKCHKDRNLITGDSPLASNQLGKIAAENLILKADE